MFLLIGVIAWNVAGRTLQVSRELRRINSLDDQKKEKIQKKLGELNQLYEAGKKEEAERIRKEIYKIALSIAQLYEDFLKKYPYSKEALNYLGLVYYDDLARPDLAKKCWEKAVEIDPNFSPALNNLATYYSHFGKHIESIETLKKAIRINPNVAVYHFNLFSCYILFRYKVQEKYGWSLPEVFNNAIREAEKARELDPRNFQYAKNLAEVYYMAHYFKVDPDWEKVLKEWDYCLSLAKTPAQKSIVYLNIGRINSYLNRKEKARLAFEKANELFPSSSARYLLEKLKVEDGENKGASTR